MYAEVKFEHIIGVIGRLIFVFLVIIMRAKEREVVMRVELLLLFFELLLGFLHLVVLVEGNLPSSGCHCHCHCDALPHRPPEPVLVP